MRTHLRVTGDLGAQLTGEPQPPDLVWSSSSSVSRTLQPLWAAGIRVTRGLAGVTCLHRASSLSQTLHRASSHLPGPWGLQANQNMTRGGTQAAVCFEGGLPSLSWVLALLLVSTFPFFKRNRARWRTRFCEAPHGVGRAGTGSQGLASGSCVVLSLSTYLLMSYCASSLGKSQRIRPITRRLPLP